MRACVIVWLALAATACVFDPRALPETPDAGGVRVDTGVFRVDAGRPGDGAVLDGEIAAVCGDGVIAAGEACDDGAALDGDGCSRDCAIEPGYRCTGAPSVCFDAPPVARDDEVRTREDTPVELDPTANDTDDAGDVLTLVDTTTPTLGRAALVAHNRLLYTPDPDVFGRDRFGYRVRDLSGRIATATITVTIDPVNDAPRARPVRARTPFQTTVELRLDADEPDGHTIRYQTSAPAHGTLGPIDQAQGRVRYTPRTGYAGVDAFTYVASDAAGLRSETATVTVVVLPEDWRVVDAQWRRALCVDGSTVTEELSNFPVLLRAPPGALAGAAARGRDLVFQASTGGRYAHEVERWSIDEESAVWIRVPRVRTAMTTCFAVYFGRSLVGPVAGASEVWSEGFTSVVHLGSAAEDAARAESIVLAGTATVAGVVGQARAFGGAGHIDLARGVIRTSSGTLSAWARVDPGLDLVDDVIIAYGTRATVGARQGLDRDELHLGLDTNERLRFFAWGSLGVVDASAPLRVATGAWRHIAVSWGDTVVLFVDGVERARAPNVADPFSSDVLTRLGAPFDSAVRRFDGALDEVRTASVARSPAWIRAERASVFDASFVTIGPLDDGIR